MLAEDVADELLEEVLDGHEADDVPVLVDDDRHLHPPRLHLAQHGADVRALG